MRSIPVVDESAIDAAESYDGVVDWLLLDSHVPGDAQIGAVGRTHDWTISRRIVDAVTTQVILAGGLSPENVADAIRAVDPDGVDSKTRTDRADGAGKDLDAVRAFVAAAHAAASA
jgi:phosphoribosylanthranilate isomerase